MAGMRKVGFNFSGTIGNLNKVKGLIKDGNFNAAHKLLGGLIPKIVGLDERLTRQQVLGTGSASKTINTSKFKSIKIPEMIRLSNKLSIMKGEVTVGLFKQVMKGYKIIGDSADELRAILDDPSKTEESLTYASLKDAREFARRLSEQTGRKFRVQTEAEWEQARNKLSGNYWTWTETEFGGTYVLRRLYLGDRDEGLPEYRFDFITVRLVEDK